MAKTVHVFRAGNHWTVKREARPGVGVFQTQKEAVESARRIARSSPSGQLVIHGRDGRIKAHETYGMPRIQDPPGKKSTKIDKAVKKITIDRLNADPHPPRG